MCLSTIYRGSVEQNNLLMKNVRMISCRDGKVVLTDLMERQLAIEGELAEADLVNGVAVIRERNGGPCGDGQ